MKKLFLSYYSKSGNTRAIIEVVENVLSELITQRNQDIEILTFDAKELQKFDIALFEQADAYIFGSPDYFGYVAGQIKVIFDEIYHIRSHIASRPTLGIISHGGGGQAIGSLENLINWTKLDLIAPVLSVKSSYITPKLKKNIGNACEKIVDALN